MKFKIFLISFLCFFISGCWNYNELSDLAIVTGAGIDEHENGFKLSLMISNSQAINGDTQNESQTTIFTGIGNNISEALVNIEMKNPKKIYLGHLAAVVIDEKIAKKDVSHVLDALVRNPESAKKYHVIIARDNKAENIIKSLSPLESFPSQNIALNIRTTSENQGISNDIILSVFLEKILKPGVNAILPSISLQGEPNKSDNIDDLKETEPKSMIKTGSIGLFKDYKLVSWTTEKESQGINIVNNSVGRIFLTNKYENNDSMVILLDKIKCQSSLELKSKPTVMLNIEAEGAIIETNMKINLENAEIIKQIDEKTKESLKSIISKGINIAKQNKTDVFGFGNMIYKNNPKYWYKLAKEWDDKYFPELDVKTKITVNIKSKGSLETTTKEKKHES